MPSGKRTRESVPPASSLLRSLEPEEQEDDEEEEREDDVGVVPHDLGRVHDDLRQERELAAELVEQLHEDRNEEEQHSGQDQECEAHDENGIDHCALDAPLQLHLFLELERNAVENDVEDARGLAGLHHRDVEAGEDPRMAGHRLREELAALDVGAKARKDVGEVLVLGLLLEDRQRRDDVQTRLDHRRELTREDLERLGLDPLDHAAETAFGPVGVLDQLEREQAAGAQRLLGAREIARGHLTGGLDAGGVDRGVSVGRHPRLSYRPAPSGT